MRKVFLLLQRVAAVEELKHTQVKTVVYLSTVIQFNFSWTYFTVLVKTFLRPAG